MSSNWIQPAYIVPVCSNENAAVSPWSQMLLPSINDGKLLKMSGDRATLRASGQTQIAKKYN